MKFVTLDRIDPLHFESTLLYTRPSEVLVHLPLLVGMLLAVIKLSWQLCTRHDRPGSSVA